MNEMEILENIKNDLLYILGSDRRTFSNPKIDDYNDRYFDGVFDAYKIVEKYYKEYYKENK